MAEPEAGAVGGLGVYGRTDSMRGLVSVLVEGLQAVGDEERVTTSAEQLADLARRDAAHRDTIREEGGLNLLVPLLGAGAHKKVTEHAARAVLNLLVSNQANRDRLRERRGVPLLVQLLDAGEDMPVTKWATWAIANLANGKKEDEDAIREEGAVPPLIRLLACGPDKVVTEKAAKALADLAVNSVNKDAIREAGGIMPLVRLLSCGVERESTKQATWALANLASKNDRNKDAIREAGGIEALVPLLRAGPHQVVTEKATQALDNLAVNSKNKDAIREAGALGPLVALLDAGEDHIVTAQCAKCWADLLSANQKNRDTLRELGGVGPLVRLLQAGPNKDVTKWATWAISNLSNGHREDEDAIRDSDGIPLLVNLLNAGPDKVVTEKAAKALTDLAVNGVNKDVIRECGAVPRLVALLGAGNTKEVTKQAAWCLSNLAGSNDANKQAILEAGGVPPLVALLGAGDDRVVTEKAAKGLSNMATTAANRDAIREAGGLEPLVRLLGVAPDWPQTEQAAWAVANLGNCSAENQLRLARAGAISALQSLLANPSTRGETKTRAAYGLLRLSEHPENHSLFVRSGAIKPLMNYMRENDGEGAAATAVTLAHLGGQDENERLVTTASVISLLARRLKDRVKFDDPSKVLRLRDYVHALRLLTLNDKNKHLIENEGAISPLVEILEPEFQCSSTVRADAAGALWNLSFSGNLRTKVKVLGVVPLLRRLLDSADPEVRENARGCLFTLGEGEGFLEGFVGTTSQGVAAGETSSAATGSSWSTAPAAAGDTPHTAGTLGAVDRAAAIPAVGSAPTRRLHVMLSYNWADRSVARELYSALCTAGWHVWMDVHEMRGSTLEAMATAVESCAVVVVAISAKYKQSAHCRMEAEFAMMKRKPVVPVIVQEGYRPDGWLGMLLGVGHVHTAVPAEAFERAFCALEADVRWHVQEAPSACTSHTGAADVSPPAANLTANSPGAAPYGASGSVEGFAERQEPTAGTSGAPSVGEVIAELRAQNEGLRNELQAHRELIAAERAAARAELETVQTRLTSQVQLMQAEFAGRMESMAAEMRMLQANVTLEAKLERLLAEAKGSAPPNPALDASASKCEEEHEGTQCGM